LSFGFVYETIFAGVGVTPNFHVMHGIPRRHPNKTQAKLIIKKPPSQVFFIL